ncbi:MAG TPA: PadR family transcriptional regulator [Actinocrinis sp.]|jgi:DNA-binding PadR family transcriptional regulator
MSEQTFLILAALADQPRHGYALVTEVAAMSDGRVKLRASTLYAALDRLLARGLIEHERDEVDSGRLRRYYRLTDEGAAAVHKEADRMAASADRARERLRLRPKGRPALGNGGTA